VEHRPPAADGSFARWLAARSARLLLELRESGSASRAGSGAGHADPHALRAEGDKRSHDLIMNELTRWRPADAVLSEEGTHDDPARLRADRVWIVDPLDGTREYGEPGRTDWAVHIGLWRRIGPTIRELDAEVSLGWGRLVAGAVALPAQHRILGTDLPPGYPPISSGPLRLVVSRTRPPAFVAALADTLGAELVPMGSAGAKIAAVITGDADAYVHAGGQYEWDSAAPVAVATATGLHASRLDGTTLEYNRADPRLPDLVICRKDLAPRLLAALD
jgi:3'(2'), 5'-bisphosphate nucleotidase